MDSLIRAIDSTAGGVRVVAALTTETCREAAARHACEDAAAVALGRACTAALLLATLTKGGERVTVQILGRGALGSVAADANDDGDVRGYVGGTGIRLPVPAAGRARLAPLVGQGTVSVVRDLGLKEPYRGALSLASGEIDDDLQSYLNISEQIESALRCDVVTNATGVVAAGGVLVQCLPGGDTAAVARARALLAGEALHAALAAGVTDPTALGRLAGAEATVLDTRGVRFRCACSRERMIGALMLVGAAELETMRRQDGGAEVTCNFCARRYALDAAELERLIHSLAKA